MNQVQTVDVFADSANKSKSARQKFVATVKLKYYIVFKIKVKNQYTYQQNWILL